ncbi:general secretion pathway protein L [Marinobacterium halophilum]|uniref:General secretion pathway protein L n=1 Tax=Marinobacterium halophilum TaxID=267374 RepID=A0A2P8F319_9GAMM|nr:PilN domain-containing protein [Marinobacterium halophilum]PSL16114.1 general secretion pathway protein L [Marinobacterium halophilum]
MNAQSGWPLLLSSRIRQFWRWWLTELEASIPLGWRRRLQSRERRLTFTGDTFEVDAGGRTLRIGIDQLATDPVLKTWHTQDKGQGRLLISLPLTELLHKVIQLPAATEPRLQAVLGFELDRHTPFSAEQASYGYRVLRRDRAARRIEVELFVLPNARRQRLLQALAEAGLRPDWVLPAGGENDTHLRSQLNLLPETVQPHRQARYRWPLAALVGVSILLVAAFYLQSRHLQRLQVALEPLQQQAEVAQAVRSEADTLEQSWRFLYARRLAQPSTLELLDELTRRLPDNTWLSRLDLEGGELQVQGESSSASDLISQLEDSALLQDVSFTSPVTINPRSRKERFSLRARFSQEVQP